jgi:hypothetical protein
VDPVVVVVLKLVLPIRFLEHLARPVKETLVVKASTGTELSKAPVVVVVPVAQVSRPTQLQIILVPVALALPIQ